jgi:hypothetical protein
LTPSGIDIAAGLKSLPPQWQRELPRAEAACEQFAREY